MTAAIRHRPGIITGCQSRAVTLSKTVSSVITCCTGPAAAGARRENKNKANLFAVRYADGEAGRADTQSLASTASRRWVQMRLCQLVRTAVTCTSLRFVLGDSAEVADEYVRKNASQGELRSHGFFYSRMDRIQACSGLPISVPARSGYRHLFDESAAILFLRNDSLRFSDIGELGAQSERRLTIAAGPHAVGLVWQLTPVVFPRPDRGFTRL